MKGWMAMEVAMSNLTNVSGRPMKFTPERLEQIRNLVERGMGREQIAETIGVTVGSLQVTCSRLGISLRRRPTPMMSEPKSTNGPPQDVKIESVNSMDTASFALVICRGDREKRTNLVLPKEVVHQIAIEAIFNNETIAEVVSRLLVEATKRKN
jgi:hypothetical protein